MAISSSATGLRPGVCTSTTRPTNPYNGQLIYETDTKKVYIYNGTSWVEQPTAGMVDAKGDLLVGSAADTVARLAVGTNGQMIVAASGETTGLKYVDGGTWTSFTPTWKIGTNTITTTAFNYGYYSLVNDVVHIKMGCRVLTYAGGGTLSVTVPSAAGIANDYNYHRCGYGELTDVSATLGYALSVYASDASTTVFQLLATHPGWTVTDSSPVNFITTADEIWVMIMGRKA